MDWAQSEVLSRVSSRVTDAWGGIGDDVDKLRVSLLTSNILADEAERWRFVDHNLSRLLLHLKDAIYDAEDVIDDFDYQELKMSVEGSSQASRILNKASSLVGEFISGKSDTVKDVQGKLDLVQVNLKKAMKLLASKRPETVEQMHAKRKTGSVVIEPEIIGRDSDKETIIKILLQLEDTVVEGTSGDVNDVTLFDVNYLTKEIVKCATGMQENSFPNLDSVYNALKEEVLSMKFLLVLDDVWNEAPLEWDKFYLPMCHGVEGSMILLTTRSTEVAKISGTLDPVFIEGLPEEPYRNLFNKCAFGLEDPKDYPELGAIAEKIRSKLKGSPLAAKTLGGLLRTNLDVQHWRNIMTSELWQMKQREGDELLEQRGALYFEDLLSSEFPYLRIFDMNNCGIKELPESIGNLKHLRYLNLSDNKIEELPESIGQLYNLQVFDLFANPLKKFPKGFTKLIGLRKLRINPRAIPMISGIGKLISLQDLSEYQVQRQHGHRIGELKDMTQLLRKLYLSGLENIDEKEEAAQAMLSNKRAVQNAYGSLSSGATLPVTSRFINLVISNKSRMRKKLHESDAISWRIVRRYIGRILEINKQKSFLDPT
ncbi:Disease resistance protein RGA2 [Rhynchospora pubera]|uniref:Disease resistance protein RGA2 n=1 Tax=Rhynchospora pubera TaxID=906938 RepID=A0AAV8DFP3_9POAL|nr:Disease resistance protein RGA2 [Rhynchospora pubera]